VPAAIAELWAALDAQRGHLASGDLAGFAEADEAFHRTIVEVGGNALTLRFYATLADRQRRMVMHALSPRREHLPVILREHEALIRIISSRDEAAFAPALRAHLDRTHRR
jgi:DNA-binding GntR family transcriptional regulator